MGKLTFREVKKFAPQLGFESKQSDSGSHFIPNYDTGLLGGVTPCTWPWMDWLPLGGAQVFGGGDPPSLSAGGWTRERNPGSTVRTLLEVGIPWEVAHTLHPSSQVPIMSR